MTFDLCTSGPSSSAPLAETTSAFTSIRAPIRTEPVNVTALLDRIYEAPGNPSGWNTVLDAIEDQINATQVTLTICRANNDPHFATTLLSASKGTAMGTIPPQSFTVLLDELKKLPGDSSAEFGLCARSSLWHRTDRTRQNSRLSLKHRVIGLSIDLQDGSTAYLIMLRDAEDIYRSAIEIKYFEALLPHLKCALDLHNRLVMLNSHRNALAFAVDELNAGVVIVNSNGEVLSVNRNAKYILSKKDGLCLVNNRLACSDSMNHRKLRSLMSTLLQAADASEQTDASSGAFRSMRLAGLSLVFKIMPVAEFPIGASRPALAVILRSTDLSCTTSARSISQLFGLTRVEATVAARITDGATRDEIADMLGVSCNTVRTHLRSVFSKMGVKRQANLVVMVLNSIATVRQSDALTLPISNSA